MNKHVQIGSNAVCCLLAGSSWGKPQRGSWCPWARSADHPLQCTRWEEDTGATAPAVMCWWKLRSVPLKFLSIKLLMQSCNYIKLFCQHESCRYRPKPAKLISSVGAPCMLLQNTIKKSFIQSNTGVTGSEEFPFQKTAGYKLAGRGK